MQATANRIGGPPALPHISVPGTSSSDGGSAFSRCSRPMQHASHSSSTPPQRTLQACTIGLPELYSRCNPQFAYSNHANPRRILTKPSERRGNQGVDNENCDYILRVHDLLQADTETTYAHADQSRPLCSNQPFILIYMHARYLSPPLPRSHTSYRILDLLGCGTFGQVVRCQNTSTGEFVAVKVIKNKPAYFNQGLFEVKILKMVRLPS